MKAIWKATINAFVSVYFTLLAMFLGVSLLKTDKPVLTVLVMVGCLLASITFGFIAFLFYEDHLLRVNKNGSCSD